MTSESPEYRGGCLCGGVRYVVRSEPIDTGYCHCRMCQRSGAPVLAWATFPLDSFRYETVPPASYASSANACREFCASCGAQIAFRERASPRIDVNIGTLDEPERCPPQYHIHVDSRISWFDTQDELPRHADAGPDGGAGAGEPGERSQA